MHNTLILPKQPQTLTPSGATLLWSEEFDAPLDLATPTHTNGLWRPNDFWQSLSKGYADFAGLGYNLSPSSSVTLNTNPFSVANSVLTIQAFRTPANLVTPIRNEMDSQGQSQAVPAWCGGMLIINPLVKTFQYGYFEFKARWPNQAKGMFPALWFYNSMGGPKTSAEFDLLEIFGTPNFWSTSQHGNTNNTIHTHNSDTSGYHLYGFDWQPGYIDVYLDNVRIITKHDADGAWFDQTMGVRINYTVDANWFPAANHPDASTPSPLIMEVDYVRQYDVKPF